MSQDNLEIKGCMTEYAGSPFFGYSRGVGDGRDENPRTPLLIQPDAKSGIMPSMSDDTQLANIINRARRGIAFTGAGISTESGLADFRSPGGVWSRNQPVMYDDFLRSRDARVRYWEMRQELYREMSDAQPNVGHEVIAKLERLNKLAAVITQNIDGLHQDAGSQNVIEIHGTARIVSCVHCGKEWTPVEIMARIDAGDAAPDCDACGHPLKSKTISFGQAMPEDLMAEAFSLASQADICLAIGSSLVVEPAASIPRIAKEHGATLVIINREPTPLDHLADLIIRDSIGQALQTAFEQLKNVTR